MKLIFVSSPKYDKRDLANTPSVTTIKAIVKSQGVPFYNYIIATNYLNKINLFYDPSHLNHKGATLLNNDLVENIKPYLD